MASLDPLQSCLGKLSDAMDDAGVPPGFVESLKLKLSNILRENALERVNGDGDIYLKSYPMEVKTELQNSDNLEQDFSPKLHTKSPRQGELVPRFPSPDDGVRLNVAGVLKGHPGVAGAAGIISDESGNWIPGFTLNLGKRRSFMSSELWGIFQGLMFEDFRRKNYKIDNFFFFILSCMKQILNLRGTLKNNTPFSRCVLLNEKESRRWTSILRPFTLIIMLILLEIWTPNCLIREEIGLLKNWI